jgi:alpha-beta hydrolase superfamily lysophospholipase
MFSVVLSTLILAAGAVGPQLVSFPTSDGGVVQADAYGKGKETVVLVHGARFDKGSWADQAAVLADSGFAVLAIDLRGHGKSHGGPQPQSERQIQLDVLAAVRHARENGATTVSVIGASLGGWAAGQAAVEAEPGEIDRVVLLAASPVQHPDRLKGDKLFIVGRGDLTGTGRSRLETVRDQYERAPDPKRLVVLESDAHAQFLFESDQGAQLMEEILSFLGKPPRVSPPR